MFKKSIMTLLLVFAVQGSLFSSPLIGDLCFFKVLFEQYRPHSTEKGKTFTKQVWSTIDRDQKINTPLFEPLNETIPGYDLKTESLNPLLFEKNKSAIKWNLWNIIVSEVVKGQLALYSPFNPKEAKQKDDGFLKYPITKEKFDGEDKEMEGWEYIEWLKYNYLATEVIDPFAAPLKSMVYPDEDSLIMDEASGFGMAVYPPSKFVWFQDKDIIKYSIKETWTFDENAKVIDKSIDAIAPVVMSKDHNGKLKVERMLFWVDFKKLNPFLTNTSVLIDRYKQEHIINLSAFFNQREFYPTILTDKKSILKVSE